MYICNMMYKIINLPSYVIIFFVVNEVILSNIFLQYLYMYAYALLVRKLLNKFYIYSEMHDGIVN